MTTNRLITIATLLCLIAGSVLAQDDASAETQPMGAPEQMKEIAFLAGVWNVDMEWRDQEDPDKWIQEKGVCTYKSIMKGYAMEMKFQGTMMGKPFQGYMIQSYDRDRGQWQTMWLDSYNGRMSFYTGNMHGDTLSVSSDEIWQGTEYISRMSTFNHTPESFDWTMESSFDGGQTWTVDGKAVYTKKK
jgi:hypothetical protein